MLTPVERVLILKGADLLKDIGPRHLLGLADVAREIQIFRGDTIYTEDDPADALYMVVEGRVRLTAGGRLLSEVGPGEAFGTWSLVDDSVRGQRAECVEDGLTLALQRDEFYDVAAGDLTMLQEVVRVLAKRLRALVAERPEEARVEGEGVEKPEAMAEAETAVAQAAEAVSEGRAQAPAPVENLVQATPGAALAAAAAGHPAPDNPAADPTPEPAVPPGGISPPQPITPEEPKSS